MKDMTQLFEYTNQIHDSSIVQNWENPFVKGSSHRRKSKVEMDMSVCATECVDVLTNMRVCKSYGQEIFNPSIYCGLVTPYGGIDLGQYWHR